MNAPAAKVIIFCHMAENVKTIATHLEY